jgi:hypothetical protein
MAELVGGAGEAGQFGHLGKDAKRVEVHRQIGA